jgi:hypothetical protein
LRLTAPVLGPLPSLDAGGPVETPDTTTAAEPPAQQLHIIAAKVLMKIMYGARFARPDLLRAVCVLARRITKWDADCDRRLLRLVAYINSTLSYRLKGWIGDDAQKLHQHYYSDADFAGCMQTQQSTTGVFGNIYGENSFSQYQ